MQAVVGKIKVGVIYGLIMHGGGGSWSRYEPMVNRGSLGEI